MTNPTKNFDDELLSAYVDGELTGEQLAQVEQQLADDPRACQLVDELRTLSREIQSLPKETIGQDLRTTVLQRAERAMLLGSESPVVSKPRAASSSRRWAWAAMAIAASLMLSIYLPTSPPEEPTSLQEEKLASAKPVPRSIPRLEAADEDVGEVLELKAVIAGEMSASSTPSADRVFGRAAGGVGGLAAVSEESSVEAEELYVASQATPEVEPTCLVHITLNNTTDGVEQFNRLLVTQGILLRQNEVEKYEARDKNVSEEESVQDEMFLVEAPIEQIENVLEASNLDTSNYAEVRLTEQQKPSELPLDHWRQWERSGKQLAQSKLRTLKQKAKSALQTQQGWATRIDARQYQGSQQSTRRRKMLTKESGHNKERTAKDPVQVLFILRAPADR